MSAETSPSPAPVMRQAQARLALRYSAGLCVVAAVVVGAVYFTLSRTLDVDPPQSTTVVEQAPDGSIEDVQTESQADVEGLVARRTLDELRDASLVALVGLFGASLLVGWVVAGRVLRPIEAAMAARRRFVQDASHELRNPLAVMRTTVDLALEDPATSAAAWRQVGTGVRDSVDRMGTVVDALLRTVRDEARTAHVTRFDPAEVLRSVVAQVEPAAVRQAVSPVVEADPGQVSGDRDAIERVVANLVDNAVRHAPRDSAVVVSGSAGGSRYAIRVRDAGSGIPADDADAVFERGHRDPDSPGLGLGLAIARDIVQAHDGELSLEQTGRIGSTFLVTLPSAAAPGELGSVPPTRAESRL